MANINCLPPVIMIEIFNYFDIKILFKFRLVCKYWRDNVAYVRIMECVFEDLKLTQEKVHCKHEMRWYEIDKKLHNVIKITERRDDEIKPNYNLLKATKYFNLSSLRRLRFSYQISGDQFDLEYLNTFKHLEILEFHDKYTFGDNKQLILPNLKILFVNYITGHGIYLTVPKLEILASRNGLEMLRFKERPPMQPKEDKDSDEDSDDSDDGLTTMLGHMLGLKERKIVTNEFEITSNDHMFNRFHSADGIPLMQVGEGGDFHGLPDEFIKNMPNLKEIHIMNAGIFPSRASFERVKETIRRILKEKQNLKRKTQVFLNSRLVSTIQEINNFDSNEFYRMPLFS